METFQVAPFGEVQLEEEIKWIISIHPSCIEQSGQARHEPYCLPAFFCVAEPATRALALSALSLVAFRYRGRFEESFQ
jgi:hypothetical protein